MTNEIEQTSYALLQLRRVRNERAVDLHLSNRRFGKLILIDGFIIKGVVTMNMINTTKIISTNGTILISAIGSSLSPLVLDAI